MSKNIGQKDTIKKKNPVAKHAYKFNKPIVIPSGKLYKRKRKHGENNEGN
jgi:hypothetical protein|tara:strand:+ start:40 stop:189 length:150 start_codon:yes stop_codon:yes gene_type:complete